MKTAILSFAGLVVYLAVTYHMIYTASYALLNVVA